VCVPEEWKKEPRSSSSHGSNSAQGSSSAPAASGQKHGEVTAPRKVRKPQARKQPASTGKELVPAWEAKATAGQKRKKTKVYRPKNPKMALALKDSLANIPPSNQLVEDDACL
jgi:hypothetical protein